MPTTLQSGSQDQPEVAAASGELRLLVAWPNPLAVFAANLADACLRRTVPPLETTSAPDHGFWRDVDLRTPFPRRGAIDSVFAHAALVGLLYAVSIWPLPGAHLEDPFTRRAMDAYTLSQYLPALHGAPAHHRPKGKHDPALARQEIISLAKNPESLRQTIVAPSPLRLKHEVELPNIVAYIPVLPAQPIAASEREANKLRLPAFMPEVIAPAAETSGLHSHTRLPQFAARVIEPTPDTAQAQARLALPAFQPRVVEAAPDLGHVSRGAGTNLAHFAPRVGEPIPNAPDINATNISDAPHASAQFIALNLHPAEVHGPVEVPNGNLRGEFAASPSGHIGASGTPGADAAAGSGARESKGPANAPAGISVAAAAGAATALAPANATGLPTAPTAKSAPARDDVRARLMAAMHTPEASVPPTRKVARESTEPRSELENHIFAGRRSYKLSVNMPNLNTPTGSWIIHFGERNATHNATINPDSSPAAGAQERERIAAPEVVHKTDPAIPGDVIRDGVNGTVILTAIIRTDGRVGEIVVAKSLDPRLDASAVQALSRWLFLPALKNGQAIEVEAVFTVPFRAKATGF